MNYAQVSEVIFFQYWQLQQAACVIGLRDRDVVTKLFDELGPRYQERPGGYLRILKTGLRTGDKAPMAYIELVDCPQDDAGDEAVI